MEHNETEGQAAQPEDQGGAQWPGLWDDLANVKALADLAMGHPQTSRLAMATVALCQVVENLAHRVEALEAPKPCEGCEEAAQIQALESSLVELDARSEPRDRGALRRALVHLGMLKEGN